MQIDLWIRGGRVFTEQGFRSVDIGVCAERIAYLGSIEESGAKMMSARMIDAHGCLVVPGFIDAHVHFNDPGRAEWEGFETGSRAAAAGGTTTVFDMPLNCYPAVTRNITLLRKKEHIRSLSVIDYALWGGLAGNGLDDRKDLEALACGTIGWKAFMCESGIEDFRMVSPEQLPLAMKMAKEQNRVLALHAEWDEDIKRLTAGHLQDLRGDRVAYLASRPIEAEQKAVGYALELAAKFGSRLHIVHVSSPKVVEWIQQAKKSGVDVTAETCPHYLIFDEDDFIRQGAILKCAPPLRPREEVEGLWDCIIRGWIDTIGSDHSPCLWSMKEAPSVWEAWGGIQGIQYTWLAMVDQALRRNIELDRIVPLGTSQVADRFGISARKGRIKPGLDADLVLLQLHEPTHADKKHLAFRNPFSPYEGFTFQSSVKKTILRGKVIYDQQEGITAEKSGKCIR